MQRKFREKSKAQSMRRRGLSYSAIKEQLDVSKSTLSYWLRDMPLTREEINRLRAHSPKRIERFRDTMRKKREHRHVEVFKHVSQRVGKISSRELFIAGLFLYWGEGGKTQSHTITFANTDPSMIRCYLKWLEILRVPREKVKLKLHLYEDMNVYDEQKFWSRCTHLPASHFRKPYIKLSSSKSISYQGFGHGTCNVIVDSRDVTEYVLQGLKYIASQF